MCNGTRTSLPENENKTMTTIIDIISLFPEIFDALDYGVCSRALQTKALKITHWNPRQYTSNVHQSVDDRPFGGGPGMVMTYPPLAATLRDIQKLRQNTHTVYLSPQGKQLTQDKLKQLSQKKQITLISGRYAGIDQRVIDEFVDEECSIGDYILSGGELPALVLIDGLARLLPGILGNNESSGSDSLNNGLLAGPYYTRPALVEGKKVPKTLISGNHKAIENWRYEESLRKTWQIRPDLIKRQIKNKK